MVGTDTIELLDARHLEDLRGIVGMFADESGLETQYDAYLNFEHMRLQLEHLIAMDMVGVLVWKSDANVILGTLIFSVTPNMFTGDLEAREIVWYVQPRWRNSRMGLKLLSEFERIASEDYDAPIIIMTHLEASMPDRLKKYYERKGYALLETNYVKRS